jgi:uncharacterized membrane protein YkoI
MGNTKVTFEQAMTAAATKVVGGIVKEIKWEHKRQQPVYEVEIYSNGQKHEIKINAVTGEIIRHNSRRSSSTQTLNGLYATEVTSARAIKLAETAITQAGGGTVMEVEWKNKDGVLICEIEVMNNGRKHEVKLNAATGEIIKFKI